MKIRFCEHSKGKGKLLRRLEDEFPGLDIKVKGCIKQCGTCREKSVVTIDKERIVGLDWDELYVTIVEFIGRES